MITLVYSSLLVCLYFCNTVYVQPPQLPDLTKSLTEKEWMYCLLKTFKLFGLTQPRSSKVFTACLIDQGIGSLKYSDIKCFNTFILHALIRSKN